MFEGEQGFAQDGRQLGMSKDIGNLLEMVAARQVTIGQGDPSMLELRREFVQ